MRVNLRNIILEVIEEEVAKKSTCCMRCGHMHKKGTSCPKPFYSKSDPKHCKNRKNEQLEEGAVKNAITGAALLAALLGAGVPKAQAQSTVDNLAAKGKIEMSDTKTVATFKSNDDLLKHVKKHAADFAKGGTFNIEVAGAKHTLRTASSKSMQIAINKATPPGQRPMYRNVVPGPSGTYIAVALF